jgi:hypothetical protein
MENPFHQSLGVGIERWSYGCAHKIILE